MLQIEQFNLSGDLIKGNLILVGNITLYLQSIHQLINYYYYDYPFPSRFQYYLLYLLGCGGISLSSNPSTHCYKVTDCNQIDQSIDIY